MKFSEQVIEALRTIHPDARKDIRRALDALALGDTANTKPLEDDLAGFSRLRVGQFRAIYRLSENKEVIVEFLEKRKDVYVSFKKRV